MRSRKTLPLNGQIHSIRSVAVTDMQIRKNILGERKMQKTELRKKLFLSVMCFALIAATALSLTGCSDGESESPSTSGITGEVTSAVMSDTSAGAHDFFDIGQGAHFFTFTVSADGSEKVYNVRTDRTVVGEALVELGLIDGEQGPYGLYVKTVDGIVADYDKDKTYWSFYIDGKYASSGVDTTDITDGGRYMFKKEK